MNYLLIPVSLIHLVVMGLFWRRWGMQSFGRIGFYFLGMAALFHGITEIIQFLLPGMNFYRTLTEGDQSLLVWVFYAAMGSVCFYAAYVFVDRRLCAKRAAQGRPPVKMGKPSPFSLIICITMAVLGVLGFYLTSTGIVSGYFTEGLIAQFLLISVFVAGVAVIQLLDGRGYYPVLFVTITFCFIIGQRSYLLAALLCVVYSLYRFHYRVSKRSILLMFGMLFLALTAIVLIRETLGREFFQGSYSNRLEAVSAGRSMTDVQQEAKFSWIQDIAYRIDGNSLASIIQRRQANGYGMAGFTSFWSNARLAIPSFLNTNKLALDVVDIEERGYIQSYYNAEYGIDFLLPLYGMMFSYYGPLSLWAGCILFGAFYAWLDWRLQQTASVASNFIALGALFCVVLMEQGFRVYFTSFRGALPLALIFMITDKFGDKNSR